MITINIDPIIFSLGPFSMRWYGLMYVVGITVGLFAAWPYATKYQGIPADKLEKIVYWAVPAGLVGARLYFVLQQPLGPYISEPWRILAFWEGGMAFYGAIFATLIVVGILAYRYKISFWKIMDMAGIFAIVGQFFGRIGNFINGDVIGYPTNLPWGVVYANPNSFAPDHTIAYQPAAVYEAISNIIIFVILWNLRKRLKPGFLFLTYLFAYSISQIILFTWRDNVVILWGLKQAQLTSIGVFIIGAGVFVWLLRRQRRLDKEDAGPDVESKPATSTKE